MDDDNRCEGKIILVFGVMCTVDVCSVLQCTVYGDVFSVCRLTMKCLPKTVYLVPFKR